MIDRKMSDDCGGGNITVGSSFDYSCDTQTSNDYSSVNDCTSNVQTDNDNFGGGNETELVNNVELSKAGIDDLKTASDENSPTKLQANDVTSEDKFLKNQSIQDVPPSSNYIRRSDRMGNNNSAIYFLSDANRIRIKEEKNWKNHPRMPNEQNHFRRKFFEMLIGTVVIAFIFIMMVYIIIFVNYPTLPTYRLSTIKSLPQGA